MVFYNTTVIGVEKPFYETITFTPIPMIDEETQTLLLLSGNLWLHVAVMCNDIHKQAGLTTTSYNSCTENLSDT